MIDQNLSNESLTPSIDAELNELDLEYEHRMCEWCRRAIEKHGSLIVDSLIDSNEKEGIGYEHMCFVCLGPLY